MYVRTLNSWATALSGAFLAGPRVVGRESRRGVGEAQACISARLHKILGGLLR